MRQDRRRELLLGAAERNRTQPKQKSPASFDAGLFCVPIAHRLQCVLRVDVSGTKRTDYKRTRRVDTDNFQSHRPIRIAPASRHDSPPGYLAGSKAALPPTLGFPHPAGKSCSSGYLDDWFRHSERGGFPIAGLRSRGNGVDQGSSYSIPHVAIWMLGNVTWRLRTVTHITGFSGPHGGWHDVLNPEDCAQPVRNSGGNYPSGRVGKRRTGDSPARRDR